MDYHYLRVFLIEVEQPPILVEAGLVKERQSRPDYLRDLFSRRIDFEHYKSRFVYVPIGQSDEDGGVVCLGRLGRETIDIVNDPPEQSFEERAQTSWRASNVLIDTRSDTDGQKVAFQRRTDVGKPFSLFSSLVNHLNESNPDSGWMLEVNVMATKSSFWDAVKEHKGEITAFEFNFATPNVLGIRCKLNDDLKSALNKNNAQKVKVGMKNKNGLLDLSGTEIADAVDYTLEGGGS